MPFGLTNAPATCQEVINEILQEYLDIFVIAYLDDILVYSEGTLEEHIQYVQKVFAKLDQWNLKLKLKKCDFHKKQVIFLGFIISTDGISIDLAKVESVRT